MSITGDMNKSINDILKNALIKLIEENNDPEALLFLIGKITRVNSYQENLNKKYEQPSSFAQVSVTQQVGEVSVTQGVTQGVTEVSVAVRPTYSSVARRLVRSANSSRNNEDVDKSIIKGISLGNGGFYTISNINDFIKSMLKCGIELWKIQYYIYICNKRNDNSRPVTTEDFENNKKVDEIFTDYTENKLLNFNDKHVYYKYIKYYFNKIIKNVNGEYTMNINALIFLTSKFVLQINKRINRAILIKEE
jgi:hypothetical protein